MSLTFNTTETKMRIDTGSLTHWVDEYGNVHAVGDKFFNDHERVLEWMTIDEITMEPVSGDPDELVHEPVFWCSTKDATHQCNYSFNEIKELNR